MPSHSDDTDTILPDDVPVPMPELPATRLVTTTQQFKAIGDPLRSRILGIIQNQPATAKQIADRLHVAPGTIGHHLQVLEAAELAQVVARRLIHGIVAKYYTRTARLFIFDFPPEIRGDLSIGTSIVTQILDEMAESLTAYGDNMLFKDGFPHARMSEERANVYAERLLALINDFVREPFDANGQVYGLGATIFLAPPYLQSQSADTTPSTTSQDTNDQT